MKVLLGLGGNLGAVAENFRRALDQLASTHEVRAWSRIYRTAAVGPPQPDYWNMAAVVGCGGSADDLLERCQGLERRAGRVRGEERWGPRPLDLDLLLFDRGVIENEWLVVPHPHLHERLFALAPAAEIAPDWRHPGLGRTVAELALAAWRLNPDAVRLSAESI